MVAGRRASRRRYVLLVVLLAALTLISLDSRRGRSGPLGAVGRGAHTVVAPVQRAVGDAVRPVGDWWRGVVDAGDLRRENRRLRDRLALEEGEDRAGRQAIEENEELKQLLGLESLLDVERVPARIIGRDPGNFDSSLTLDHGSEHGIAVDMPVVSPAGDLVGTVIDVGRGFSVVRVLTDPAFSVGVKLPAHPGSNATTGIASGQVGERRLVDDDIDAQKKVLVGDMVVTSASPANLYPPDLPVGTVAKVEPQPGGLPQRVYIEPYVDLGGLEYVAVLLWVQGEGPVVVTTTTATTTTTFTAGTTVTTGGGG
jgi:rod shape-determining protein MreC